MIGEEGGGGGIHACGCSAFEFGADGVEVHEPTLEQGPRHLLQNLVGLPVQLDQVVQGAKDVGDGALGGEWGERDPEPAIIGIMSLILFQIDSSLCGVIKEDSVA